LDTSLSSSLVIVGAGRIAWHLGRRLRSKGIVVHQVINRSEDRARQLAAALHCPWTTDLAEVLPQAGWVLIAVRDDSIADVAAQMAPHIPDALVTHTSGATPGGILSEFYQRYGVFYPLQTFSMERTPVWSKIPFCIDAAVEADVLFLRKTAKTIGNLVYRVSDEQRARLHVAAVFANNFANHCFAIAEKILSDYDLPFEMLHPLMEETLNKALMASPAAMQTGPAIRGDRETIERHLHLLRDDPAQAALYLQLSKSIRPDLDGL
jgi:predicted short-subunit dehydrogenase-like oxidoreductase (DUF2520 family)